MSDNPPPKKRARTESAEAELLDASDTPIVVDEAHEVPDSETVKSESSVEDDNIQGDRVKDEEFWFEDGTVVLVAEDVEFRVYQGPLADHSPVFRDLFSQPGEETIDADCPIVQLTDAADDLSHILRIFVPNRYPTPYTHCNPSFDAISASIRLGTKYRMTHLVQHAIDYLKQYYPSSFDIWSKQQQWKGPPGFSTAHAIGVVNLARLTAEDSLLPVALLACCALDESIVRGVKREDGSYEHLSLEDVGLCFKAKGTLIEASVAMCLRICSWAKVSTKCAHVGVITYPRIIHRGVIRNATASSSRDGGGGKDCWEALRNATLALPNKIHALRCANPLLSFEKFYKDFRGQLCEACWAMVRERDLAERRAAWNRLPEMLGITVNGWGSS